MMKTFGFEGLGQAGSEMGRLAAFKQAMHESLVKTDERLLSASQVAQSQWDPYSSDGGTSLAIAGDNFVVMAADTRMHQMGFALLSRDVKKITILSDSVAIANSGFHGDMVQLGRVLRSRLDKFRFDYRADMTADLVAEMLARNLYYRRFFPYVANCVLGGIDENGKGAVFRYDPVGMIEKLTFGSEGDACGMIDPFLDAQVGFKTQDLGVVERPALTVERAQELAADAFRVAAERETGTGDSVYIVTLVAGKPPQELVRPLRED